MSTTSPKKSRWSRLQAAASLPTPRGALLTAMGLLTACALLFLVSWLYPRTVRVSVCNETKNTPLHDVQVVLASRQPAAPPARVGSLDPGDCRSVDFESRGESGASVLYRVGAAMHESPGYYAEAGFHIRVAVRGAGMVAEDTELPGMSYPPFLLFGLALLTGLWGVVYVLASGGLLVARHSKSRASRSP